jgi:putative OPT family oligopeptide transporter
MAERDLPPLPPPVVPSSKSLAEITVKGVVLGLVIAMLMAAANAYLGLKVGMTVAASIPAAAISLGVLRMFRRSTILENNQVQTIASAGASTVSGIIFTVPALVMMGYWQNYDYWTICMFVLIGGVMGVVFTTPLRRALIVDARLAFPEGVATAEVLKTGPIDRDGATESKNDASAQGFKRLLEASVLGALFKLFEGGFKWFADGAAMTAGLLKGKWLFMIDATLLPSLLGVGWIVGLNIGVLMISGAVIGTLIATPLNWYFNPEALMAAAGIEPGTALESFTAQNWADVAGTSWGQCRRIGVGCMIVGGIWSLITLAKPLVNGVKASIAAFQASRSGGAAAERTEYDTPFPIVIGIALLMCVPLFFTFHHVVASREDAALIAGIMTVLMLVFGFLFCSVAGYMAGLVGSSNNPVSGVTMSTVIVASLVLVQIMGKDGAAAQLGPAAVLYLAALICTGACIAGDNLQDLKCGHVVGSTPWKQQLCLVLGTVGSAAVIPLVLDLLDQTNGIGRAVKDGVAPFAAPQATLMKELATGIFGQGIAWNYILIGCGLAVLLIVLDNIQKARGSSFRFPVLAVAVGIYLPFGLSVLIFLGGLLSWYVNKKAEHAGKAVAQNVENRGMLLASGLITGEAVMGVLIAIYAVRYELPKHGANAQLFALLAAGALIVYLYRRTRSAMNDA